MGTSIRGVKRFVKLPQLRGVIALNLVVASAGSIVIVNTVSYVRDRLGGSQADVAWTLAASGGGTLFASLILPYLLRKFSERSVMRAGALVLIFGASAAAAFSVLTPTTIAWTAVVWAVIGGGMALVVTPTGQILRGAVEPKHIPEIFAAQFSLSHLAWLVTYPLAGLLGAATGFTVTWSTLAFLAVFGTVAATLLWPRNSSREPIDTPVKLLAR
ncbi:MFS transporter [Leucobacter coleopterorum]|uniref:MFS transporter n=1 Tax=Leucobacter coleopterorum TaxID=2714933 RepID=UPI001FCBFB7D|nr:MFS transporter [Leucobacter coleopterorum]